MIRTIVRLIWGNGHVTFSDRILGVVIIAIIVTFLAVVFFKTQHLESLKSVAGEKVEIWAKRYLYEQFPKTDEETVRISTVVNVIDDEKFHYATVRFYNEQIAMDDVLHLNCSSNGSKERFLQEALIRGLTEKD